MFVDNGNKDKSFAFIVLVYKHTHRHMDICREIHIAVKRTNVFTFISLNQFSSVKQNVHTVVKQNVLIMTCLNKARLCKICTGSESHVVSLDNLLINHVITVTTKWLQIKQSKEINQTLWVSILLLLWTNFIQGWHSVETVMLRHEEDVEHHREKTKTKLRGITKYQPPLIWDETHTLQLVPTISLFNIQYDP